MSDGFKSNKSYQLQLSLLALALESIFIIETAKGSPTAISRQDERFLGSQELQYLSLSKGDQTSLCFQNSCQQELPAQQGLLPATALLAPSTNVIAQSALRCRLLITASAMCDMLQQCKARIGPTANGRHHKKQCHAPLPIALLLPFIIEEQTVLKSKKEHGGEWGVTVRDIVRILTGSFPFSKY